jgi:hypothetical protein
LILSFGREGKAKEREREIQGSDLELEFELERVLGRRGNKTTSSWSKRGNNLDFLNQFCWIRDFDLEVLRLVVVEGE